MFFEWVWKKHNCKNHIIFLEVQSYTAEFVAANIQLDWLKISSVYDKSNKHTTICDSNNLECECTFIQNVSIESASNTYSVAKKLKYNISDATEKHMLYKKLAAWNCNGCLVTLLKDYVNNLNNLNDLNARNHQRKVSITLTQTKELTLI